MSNQDSTIQVDGESGSSLSWLLSVEDRGGDGNSHEYRISVQPEATGSHLKGDASWEFTIIGEWEMHDFARVIRELAGLIARHAPG